MCLSDSRYPCPSRPLYRMIALALILTIGLMPLTPATLAHEPDSAPAAPAAPMLSVRKTIVSPQGRTTFATGETVIFQAVVRNVGTTTVVYLPQEDEFSVACLEFVPKATPNESGYNNTAGTISWQDLTFLNGRDLAPGEAFTTTMEFLVVGPAGAEPEAGVNTVRVAGALDSNGTTIPAAQSSVSFTCAAAPSLALDKTLVAPAGRSVLLAGETATFQVVVTNTGSSTIVYLPQADTFDTACLTFLPKANPYESFSGSGVIQWHDLTFVNNADLAPGQAFTTTMEFLVTGPISGTMHLGDNTAEVSGAIDDNGLTATAGPATVLYSCAVPASIGDYVWHDANSNGLQDDGAGAGLNGVTVRLYRDDDDGIFEPGTDDVLVATEVTAGDGAYLFDMLHAGSYWVDLDTATVPAPYRLTVGDDPVLVTVDYGDFYPDADFGFSAADLRVLKSDSPDPVLAGQTLTYTLLVSNHGPSTANDVLVTDTLPAGLAFVSADPAQAGGPNPLTWALGDLAVGASRTITVVTTVGQGVSGFIVNTVQVTTTTPDPAPGNNDAITTTLVISPAIAVAKSADPPIIRAGDTVTYTFAVSNTGDTPLGSIVLADDHCAPALYQGGDADSNGLLEAGEIWLYRCVTAVFTDTVNTVTASGQPTAADGIPLPGIGRVSSQDDALVDVINPGIHVDKNPDQLFIYPNGTVTYTYIVRNVGDVPLTNFVISDDLCSPLVYRGGDTDGDDVLDLPEVWTFTCQDTLANDTLNIVTAQGQPCDENGILLPANVSLTPVQAQADALVEVLNPAIGIEKSGPTQASPGEVITFTYAVTNLGDTPLRDVSVSDDVCGAALYVSGDVNGDGRLDLAEPWYFRCVYTVQAGDPDPLINIATAAGTDALGLVVTAQDTWSTDILFAELGGVIYLEQHHNTFRDPDENTLVGGGVITITDSLGNVTNLLVTSGIYIVTDLIPGVYTVTFRPPSGYIAASPITQVVTLEPGDSVLDVDFGVIAPTAVRVLAFTAAFDRDERGVLVRWMAEADDGLREFLLWRSDASDGPYQPITDAAMPAIGHGPVEYHYLDRAVAPKLTYWYRLQLLPEGSFIGPVASQPYFGHRVFLPMLGRQK